MDFEVFKNKYILEGELTVLTALHIGSGLEKDSKDAPFISLDGNNEFYIPGSSFRGYLSTKLERILNSENGIRLVDKDTNEELNEADVKLIFGYTNLDKLEINVKSKEEDDETKNMKKKNEEIINRIKKKVNEDNLKNIKSMAGRIHIADMPLCVNVETVTRDGIKIDRKTGATKKGGKFDYDVVPAGTVFKLVIELENIEKYQLDLIGLAFNDIMTIDGDLFGGKISRGIGRCRVEKELKISSIEATNKEALKNYIFKRKFEKEKEKFKFETNHLTLR